MPGPQQPSSFRPPQHQSQGRPLMTPPAVRQPPLQQSSPSHSQGVQQNHPSQQFAFQRPPPQQQQQQVSQHLPPPQLQTQRPVSPNLVSSMQAVSLQNQPITTPPYQQQQPGLPGQPMAPTQSLQHQPHAPIPQQIPPVLGQPGPTQPGPAQPLPPQPYQQKVSQKPFSSLQHSGKLEPTLTVLLPFRLGYRREIETCVCCEPGGGRNNETDECSLAPWTKPAPPSTSAYVSLTRDECHTPWYELANDKY